MPEANTQHHTSRKTECLEPKNQRLVPDLSYIRLWITLSIWWHVDILRNTKNSVKHMILVLLKAHNTN